jgi:cobalt-zinc-cadmium efflux system outer membrane protein
VARGVVVVGMLSLSLIAVRAFAAPLRLAEVLRRIAAEGPEQAVARAQIPVAQAEVTTARMFPNPALALSGGQSEPVFAAALQLRLPVLGQRGARVRAAERTVEQARAELILGLWRLRRDARVAYFAVARGDDQVDIAVEIEALTRRVADMAAERFDVGAGTRLEREQAALVHTRALQEVVDRRSAAKTARIELARLLGFADEPVALQDRLGDVGPTPPLEGLRAAAASTHPEVTALVAEREAARARANAGRADRRPVPTVEIGAELLDPSTCGGTSRCVGPRGALSFDLPAFNLNGGPIARAQAEALLAEAKLRAARLRIDAAVRGTYEAFQAADVRARFFDAEYLPAANRVEQMAREGFVSGKTGLLPLIEAQRAVLEARLGRAEALFAVQAARADLEEASGVALSAP